MVSKGRLEAFSDGVMAIAITLLVIELQPPAPESGVSLASALWHQWPSYVAYVVSFLQIGVIWLNHHRMFQSVRVVDGTLLVLNLLLLLWVARQPSESSLIGSRVASSTRWVRGRVSEWTTASATSPERIMSGRSGSSGVRPRPIAKSVATPPGHRMLHRTPRR